MRPGGVVFTRTASAKHDGVSPRITAVAGRIAHYKGIQSTSDLPELLLNQIEHFFEHYKDLEKGKWVKVQGWADKEAAKQEILDGVKRFEAEGK